MTEVHSTLVIQTLLYLQELIIVVKVKFYETLRIILQARVLLELTRPATVSSVVGFIFLYNFGNKRTLLPDLYNSTHHQNPENVKIWLKIGRIM